MSRPPVILVTGFGSFPGVSQNPSEKLVTALAQDMPFIHGLILPVVYKDGMAKLDQAIAALKPDIIISFGVSGAARTIHLETTARNEISTSHVDAAGVKPSKAVIDDKGRATYATSLPLELIEGALLKNNLPAAFSASAGQYVCNYTFYHLMQRRGADGVGAVSGFVHIPHENTGVYNFEKLLDAGKIIIETCQEHYARDIAPKAAPLQAPPLQAPVLRRA